MPGKLKRFFEERYGAYLLMLATERYIPGMLVKTQWIWDFLRERPEFHGEEALAWELLEQEPGNFRSELVQANIIQESITDKVVLSGAVSLPQYGLSLGSDLDSEFTLVLNVTGVKARVFTDTSAPYHLMQDLLELKKSNPTMWKWVNDDFLITESYYVTSFTAEFRGEKGASVKAAFENAGQQVSGDVKLHWKNESTLTMVGTPSVPIAVRGLKV
ncbi:hypothetical protein MUP77_05765 [Candidatus Bathyarchaeota archaeon]|nr:hypothetical protein [Candidatus Bathyarchaeota archaeon]